MARKSWILTDVSQDVSLDELAIRPGTMTGRAKTCSARKRTLHGGLRDGVDVVDIDNGTLAVTVVPTRGMGLWRAKVGELTLGWRSPAQGPVHPSFVPLWEPSGLGWLAGFDELMCRCGLESNGGPVHGDDGRLLYPLHGKIANTPAHRVELSIDEESGAMRLTGTMDEARLYHQKLQLTSTVELKPGELALTITDVVKNLSAEPAELELLYHTNFGPPLVDPGAQIVAPVKQLIPQTLRAAEGVSSWQTYGAPEPGFTEQVYFVDLLADADGATLALLRNAHGNQGVSLQFNKRQLPYFTLWKSTQALEDGYVTGLEPGINLPNQRNFEAKQNRVTKLAGHEERTFTVRIEVHPDAASVEKAEKRVAKIQGTTKPQVFDQPQPTWSAG